MSHPLKAPIKPDVPEILLQTASPIEKHILNEISVSRQQNDRLIETSISIEEQVMATNGRVNNHDKVNEKQDFRISECEKVLHEWKRLRRSIIKIFSALSMLGPLLYIILEHSIEPIGHWLRGAIVHLLGGK